MTIKEIIIENFLCYYNVKKFELSEGLNIILGENGEGKTKFFEALEWLLNENNSDLEQLVSAKALDESDIGENITVRVSITVEQYDEIKILSRYFFAKKNIEGGCQVFNLTLQGIEENKSGERTQVEGRTLLDQIFPFQIKRYSMFKGESELDIFKNDEALINLINLFSDAKHFDKYSEKGKFLRDKAEKAVEEATKSDSKNQALYKNLESEITFLINEKSKKAVLLNHANDQIRKIGENLQEAENHVKNAEALEIVNKRIKDLENKISETAAAIDENYTTSLFDDSWILMGFESIHKDFTEKVNRISEQKRELQTKHDREQGIKVGVAKAKADILNNSIPLPIGVPSKAHMEEMLRDQICKVCNRPVTKESEAYEFMMKRLKEYLESQDPESDIEDEKNVLFKHDHISRLVLLTVAHEDNLAELRGIKTKIEEHFEFNDKRKSVLNELNSSLEKEISEREKIVGNSSMGADSLTHVLKNYNGWQRDVSRANKEVNGYESEIKNLEEQIRVKKLEKEGIDVKSAHTFLIKTRQILREIEQIFVDTKEKKFDEFITLLENKSNDYFTQMNKGAFTGSITFTKNVKNNRTSVSIELREEGRQIYKPNQSLQTSMHISILFAISQLAKEKHEEGYPLIFDAPTSSFGETKTGEFLNMISETGNQIILLSKDFIARDEQSNKLMIKPEFNLIKRDKAFWVKVQRPFDSKVLKTINTEIITL
jgi:DNA sulfur modification protein DndD